MSRSLSRVHFSSPWNVDLHARLRLLAELERLLHDAADAADARGPSPSPCGPSPAGSRGRSRRAASASSSSTAPTITNVKSRRVAEAVLVERERLVEVDLRRRRRARAACGAGCPCTAPSCDSRANWNSASAARSRAARSKFCLPHRRTPASSLRGAVIRRWTSWNIVSRSRAEPLAVDRPRWSRRSTRRHAHLLAGEHLAERLGVELADAAELGDVVGEPRARDSPCRSPSRRRPASRR